MQEDLEFEVHGAIQILHDYTIMHLRRRNCVENIAAYEFRNGPVRPFDQLVSLRRLRKQVKKVDGLLEEYSKSLI